MQNAAYAHTARSYGASHRSMAEGHYWSRLHAAAVDRSFIDRVCKLEVAPAMQAGKRIFDFIFAVALVIGLSPALLLIAILAAADGGPILFGHKRIGRNGKTFVCWKFRTMVMNADRVLQQVLESDPAARAEWEECFKLKQDPRITRVGRFLRTTSLDELPQLLNVLTGEMSLVGPRPIVADEVRRYGAAFHEYAACRPGITGFWQVSGRSDVDYGGRVRLDQQYVRKCSLITDIKVLWKTAFVVIQRRGAY